MRSLKTYSRVVLLSAAVCLPLNADEVGDVAEEKLQTYRMAVKGFGSHLKAELQKGMKEGGPVAAIGICNTQAMLIAAEHSKKSGFEMARVSLKPRNSQGGVPDAWEKAVLMQFEQRKANGEDPQALEYAKIVEDADGKREIRYMKAVPTAQVCLACHGATEGLDPVVVERLDKLYPADQARGFKAGDLRGAFSIRETLTVAE